MTLELLVAVTSLVASLLVSLFVIIKNHKKADNVYFSILALLIGLYSIFNYLAITSTSSDQAFVWAKFILLISIPQGVLLLFFASTVRTKKLVFIPKLQIALVMWIILCWVLTLNNLIFKAVTIKDGVVSIVPGPAIPIYALVHLTAIGFGSRALIKAYRSSSGRERRQLKYVTIGLLSSFVLTFLTTLVLPLIFESTILLSFSPIFLTLSVVFTAYAIIAHHLFDIRAALARSVAFILLIAVINGLFASGIYIVTKIIYGTDVSYSQLWVSIILAIMLAYSFGYIKKTVEKVTDRIFFQKSYNPQALIAELNQILVANLELSELITKTSNSIRDNFKTSSCLFLLNQSSYGDRRVFGDIPNGKSLSYTGQIEQVLNDLPSKVYVIDTEATGSSPILASLNALSTEVVVRIDNVQKGRTDTIGYILIGSKMNGTLFSDQDIRMLEIIANELVIAIQNALRFDQIEDFNATLQQKVADATKELRKSNEKLKALDEAKDEFISMASHQLRTPLTSVKGYLSMLAEGDGGVLNETQRRFVDQAFISSQRMVYLIADLLNVSRLKTGKFIIEQAPTYLPDVVQSEIAQLNETVKSRGLTMEFKKPKNYPNLMLDETKIRQVIMNFTDNAIYYTPLGGRITVNLTLNDDVAEFLVKDNGIGVPKHEQPHLFTKFYRAGNARKARPDGTGLGLFMAKKVVVAQGGALIFKSTEGKGSTFGFRFNVSKIAAPEQK